MVSMTVFMLPTILDLILEHTPANSTGQRPQETMTLLLPEMVAGPAAADGAEQAAVLLGHRRGVGVEVRRVGVGTLRRGLWCALTGAVGIIGARAAGLRHRGLVGLVLGEGVLLPSCTI